MNVISTESFILELETAFGLRDGSRRNDIVLFLGNAVQAIGCYLPMEKVDKIVKVQNGRAPFPCDLEYIVAIEDYNGQQLIQARYSEVYKDGSTYPIGGGYGLNPGYIITPYNKGEVKFIYSRIPVDKKGLPLVVDNFNYKEACKFFIMSQLIASGEKHPVFTYDKAFEMFDRIYLPRAQGNMITEQFNPEAFGQLWNRSFGQHYGSASNYQSSDNTSTLPEYKQEPLDLSNLSA